MFMAIKPTFNFWWCRYKYFVKHAAIGNTQDKTEDISFWRDTLFANFITYLIPVCLLALIPCVIISIRTGFLFLAIFDTLTAISIPLIALSAKLNLTFRKAFVVFILYCLSIVLLAQLGSFGPGRVYLLALSVFATLIFRTKVAYWSVAANFIICAVFAVGIYQKSASSLFFREYDLAAWIAVSSNLIFLSWVSVASIGKIINGLESTILKEHHLKGKLQQEVLDRIELNKQLEESEGHYKSLFYLNPSPMWVFDLETLQFLQVNESAIENYGYSREEFLCMTLKDLRPEEGLDGILEIVSHIKENTTMQNMAVHRRKNKQEFYVDIRCSSISYAGKEARLVIARDITEQVNYTKAIEAQNAQLQEIAFIQSHGVRLPLARIMGLIELITHNENDQVDPKLLGYLDQSAKELDEVIRTITKKSEQS